MLKKREWLAIICISILSAAVIALVIGISVAKSTPEESSGNDTPAQRVPEGWHLVETERVTFYIPPQWQWHDIENFDTEVGAITYEDITLVYDYGVLAGPAFQEDDFQPQYVVSYTEIDGREALLVKPALGELGGIGVFFGNLNAQGTVLNIYAQTLRAYSELEMDIIFQIFATIRFK